MKRWKIVTLVVVLVIGAGVALAYRAGARLLREQILAALGPSSRLAAVRLHWFSLELTGLSIDAPQGWPAARQLEAERVVIVPDLRSLFGSRLRIASISVDKPYVSLLRLPGKLVMVPSLTETARGQLPRNRSYTVVISKIEVNDGRLELYDATVSKPPLKTTVERIAAVIRDVTAPAESKMRFELDGIVKGVRHDGEVALNGWVGPAGHDSWSRVTLNGVDLVALQPYLANKQEARVNKGSLDLSLDSTVRNNNLDGNGTITLTGLQFAPTTGFLDTFMGLPRNAVIGFLKDHNDTIKVNFTLTGNTRQPNFSLNESLTRRIATAMAGELGVSIKNVAGDIGGLGRRGLEEAGSLMGNVAASIRGVFGGNERK
jgi:hypothetical protein